MGTTRSGLHMLVAGVIALSMAAACQDEPFEGRAIKLQKQKKWRESLVPIERALVNDPDSPRAYLLQGRAYYRLGMPLKAIDSLDHAVADPEFVVPAGMLQAEILLRQGKLERALEVTNLVLEVSPDVAVVVAQRARIRAYLGTELEEGLLDVARMRTLQPGNIEIGQIEAIMLTKLGRSEQARARLDDIEARWLAGDEAISNKKGLLTRWCSVRARWALAVSDSSMPRGLFGYCLKEYDEHAEVIEDALEFYRLAARDDDIERLLTKMVRQQPTELSYRLELAERLAARGLDRKASLLLAEGARQAEGEAKLEALWALVEHYEAIGNLPAAIEAVERAMKLQEDPRLPFRLVDLLVRDGQLERATELAQGLEGRVYVDLAMGRILLAQGRPREALARIEQGLEVWPENAGAQYYAAQAAEQIGDTEQAIEFYRKALQADPDATDATAQLDRLTGDGGGDGATISSR